MNAQQYAEHIKKAVESLGDNAANIDVVYATDDEGNSFPEVGFRPSIKYRLKRDEDDNDYDDSTIYETVEEFIEGCCIPTTYDEAMTELEPVLCIN